MMAKQRLPQLTIEDLEKRFGGAGIDLEPTEDSYYTDRDTSAPDGEKTICAGCLAAEIEGRLKRRLPNHRSLMVLSHKFWDGANAVVDKFLGRQNWKGIDYIENATEADHLRNKLANFAPGYDFPTLKDLLLETRELILKSSRNSLLMFTPKFRLNTWHGKTRKLGQFVKIFMTEEMRFLKIPFLLGLEIGKFHYLPGCEKCIQELRYFTLETGKKEMLDKEGKPVFHPRTERPMYYFFLKALPTQTYEDACRQEARKLAIAKLNPNPFSDIVDTELEKRIGEQSFFAIALDIFTPELLEEISQPGLTPKEISELVLQVLREKTPEEIGKVKILLGKKIGSQDPRGMPGGLGLPGGSLDPEETPYSNDLDFQSILPPSLYEKAERDPLFKTMIQRTCDEFIDRTGFDVQKVIGRIFRLQKNEQHVDHHLLVVPSKSPMRPILRTNKMVANPGQQWYALEEYYGMPAGNDRIPRSERPNFPFFSNLKIFLSIFENHGLPLAPAMARFRDQQTRR